MFIGRTDAKGETPILSPPHAKSWLIGKDPDAGKDWRWEEKGMTEDDMVGWHHWLNGHEFEWTPGIGDRQGGLACCNPWGCKESYTTERQNWTELKTNTGLAKKFVQVFLLHLLGKPERTYWLTQYLVGDLSKLVSWLENSQKSYVKLAKSQRHSKLIGL